MKSVNRTLLLQGENCYLKKYITALKQDKYYIEVQNDDAIKRDQIFFDFMQRTFNRLDGLYLHDRILLIDTIIENQLMKHSAEEFERLNRGGEG